MLHWILIAWNGWRVYSFHGVHGTFLLLGLRDVIELANVAELDLESLLDQECVELDRISLLLDFHGSDATTLHIDNI